MIDAEHARILKMMAQTIDIVTIALLSKPVGVQRREFPVLTLGEKAVRGGAAADVQRKHLAAAPDMVAVAGFAQGAMGGKGGGTGSRLFVHRAVLLFGLALDIMFVH